MTIKPVCKVGMICLLLCFSGMSFLRATPVGQDKARQMATYFWQSLPEQYQKNVTFTLVKEASVSGNNVAYYIFNTQYGFVIISGDDRVTPVLGYSLEQPFDEQTLPPQAAAFLRCHRKAIAELTKSEAIKTEPLPAWQKMYTKSTKSMIATVVPVLISTTWHQQNPYNNACPVDTLGYGGHALVGCVALSMAQICKYWNYPKYGEGQNSYSYEQYGVLSANFEDAEYEYSLMPNKLTESSSAAEKEATSLLCYHCGVAANMMYGATASGSYSLCNYGKCAETALRDHFRFYDAIGVKRHDYDDNAWTQLLKSELSNGCPIYYSAVDPDSAAGHAFVCDGYNSDGYFHINWGWGGQANGYFALSNFSPSPYHFIEQEQAIIHVYPEQIFSVSPKEVDLPTAGAQPSSAMPLQIYSLSNDTIHVSTQLPFQISKDGISWHLHDTLYGKKTSVYVRYVPESEGYHTGNVQIHSLAADTSLSVILHGNSCLPIKNYPWKDYLHANISDCWQEDDSVSIFREFDLSSVQEPSLTLWLDTSGSRNIDSVCLYYRTVASREWVKLYMAMPQAFSIDTTFLLPYPTSEYALRVATYPSHTTFFGIDSLYITGHAYNKWIEVNEKLFAFQSYKKEPSESKQIIVTGKSLSQLIDFTVTPPFEVCAYDNDKWQTHNSIVAEGKTMKIRYNPQQAGQDTGMLTLSSAGVSPVYVSLYGTATPRYHTIFLHHNDGGQILPVDSAITVEKGENVTINFAPEQGYKLLNLFIDNEEVIDSIRGYTFKNIQQNHVLYAYFSMNTGLEQHEVITPLMYPNPVIAEVGFRGLEFTTTVFYYQIIDNKGEVVVHHQKLPSSPLNLSFLKPGLYLFKVISDSNVYTFKFIKL
ncbi:MAG: thiol protease/hemagglutinin PrtT [Bacteroidales bacterium]|jgi:hypothetical protein|nr:thiol protease/hemagglutinin PrtT [Bacteroidales bacterium]